MMRRRLSECGRGCSEMGRVFDGAGRGGRTPMAARAG